MAILTTTDWLVDWSPQTPLNNLTDDYRGFTQQVEQTFEFFAEHLPKILSLVCGNG
jgi:hypothetical protein